ncbi:NUDIX domain-containing protein [Panacibacter ginsenosidivorans]|uniref:NUDIX domain-containing protein n=1 Tax=Panacibacter ginsenosidivorans TaxID=1813871 RepID=A0A5B8V443_9BACT|nr:NUDIX domain-containing protein [Panacibacter ginsenosidivorans]QEC65795.1 NUDIX domain-containing protein [Panacibacter ginsenosidivorans]
MAKRSAGILLYRFHANEPEVLLVHPGGPFWQKKDLGAWSIPKGEFEEEEDPLDAAKREMEEETGIKVSGAFIELTPAKQKSGKTIYAWSLLKDADVGEIKSNSFEMEWPPKSGKKKEFPEIDKAGWFAMAEAKEKIIEGQVPFIIELEQKLKIQ